MEAFRTGEKLVLVATDIASRGIDVEDITHVVNFDMPIDTETYVHRIGRTARAGASGVAISFCGRKDAELLKAIQRRTGANLTLIHDLPDLVESEAGLMYKMVTMVPPPKLRASGVDVCHLVQRPGGSAI